MHVETFSYFIAIFYSLRLLPMATSTRFGLTQITTLAILLTLLASTYTATGCYTSMFAFGDSITDAGNYLITEKPVNLGQLPYGSTYFHRATGRFSDGRIIPDFIAQALGLPLLPPYLAIPSDHDVRKGVNFAVGGATALDSSFFAERGMPGVWTNCTLRVQIGWFKRLLPSLCSSETDCEDFLGRSLFWLGEIGGNDFSFPLCEGRNLDEIRPYIPDVLDALISAANELIVLGARTLVVPGFFPIGCIPAHLTSHLSPRKEDYDPVTGCLKEFSKFSELYDVQLQGALDRLRQQNPHATIIYANYYKASTNIFVSPENYGFDKSTTLRTCCGGGGPYNYNESAQCGFPGSSVCDDPSRAVYWDGYHFTEAAYKVMAMSVLEGPNADPPIAHACAHIQRNEDLTRYVS